MERFPTVLKFGGKWDEETRKNNTWSATEIWSYNGPGGNTTAVNPVTGGNVITSWGNWANVGPQYVSTYPWDMGTTNAATADTINSSVNMTRPPKRTVSMPIGSRAREPSSTGTEPSSAVCDADNW